MTRDEQALEQIIEEFSQEAIRVLNQAGQEINQLAQRAYRSYDSTSDSNDAKANGQRERLVQVARQFEKLAERHITFSRYLENGMDSPPDDDDAWPRIRIIQSQEEERSRLARELEDSIGQLLANAVFELASVRYLLGTETQAVDDGLSSLQDELEQGLTDVRQLIADLDPPTVLGSFGLMAGLRRYLERFETLTNIETTLDVRAITERLPATVEIAIFRVVQEALENVRRHANATRVDVSVCEEDGQLVFSIIDNGVGMGLEGVGGRGRSLGLVSMRDRAELLQGKLRIRSDTGRGTQIILSIPYPIFMSA
jgi:two-component system sensor histidine kinase DegS